MATIRLSRVVIPMSSPVRAEERRPEIVNHPIIAQSNSLHTAVQRHDLIVMDNNAAAIRASQRVIVPSQPKFIVVNLYSAPPATVMQTHPGAVARHISVNKLVVPHDHLRAESQIHAAIAEIVLHKEEIRAAISCRTHPRLVSMCAALATHPEMHQTFVANWIALRVVIDYAVVVIAHVYHWREIDVVKNTVVDAGRCCPTHPDDSVALHLGAPLHERDSRYALAAGRF